MKYRFITLIYVKELQNTERKQTIYVCIYKYNINI